jgi:excisionase family DNA binding protein
LPEPYAYSRQETAELLHVSVRHVDELLADGHIDSVKYGARRLIPATEIQRLLQPGTTIPGRRRRPGEQRAAS